MANQNNKKKKESDHTPEAVWKALKEVIAVQKNLAQKIDETRQNIDKLSGEIDKVTRQTANNINKLRGDWDHRWGDFVEILISDNVERLFEDYGIIKGKVETINKKTYCFMDGATPLEFEFDSITINGDKVIITEAKKKMTKTKVKDFIKKVQNFLAIKDNGFSNKKVYIAIGYLKADNEKLLIKYAEGQGLFVIKAVGDSAKLVNSPQTFKPKQLNLNV